MSFFGQPAKTHQLPTMSPQQIANQNQFGQMALQGLQQYNPQKFNFDAIQSQAEKNLQTRTLPSIAERFTSMGSGPNSSAFRSQFTGAGTDLQGQLAALRAQYGLQQQGMDLQRQGQFLNLAQLGQQPQFENIFQPETSGLFGGLLGNIGQGIGTGGTLAALGGLGGAGAGTAAAGAAGAAGTGAATAGTFLGMGPVGWGVGGGLALMALLNYLAK